MRIILVAILVHMTGVPWQVSGEMWLVISEIEDDQWAAAPYAGRSGVLDESLKIPLADNQAPDILGDDRILDEVGLRHSFLGRTA